MIIKICIALCVTIALFGCSSADKKTIETHQNLISRVNKQGITEYIFTLNWYVPQIQQRREKDRFGPAERQDQLNRTSQLASSSSISNEVKLEMEDLAVVKLAKTLKNKDLCANSHTIDEILWQEKSIKLRGHCN